MKKSNFWIFIPLLLLGFLGLAFSTSFCFSDTFCLENGTVGAVLMIIGFGGFLLSLALINKWNNDK